MSPHAPAITPAALHCEPEPDDHRAWGERAFWSGTPGWIAPERLTGANLDLWRQGHAAAHAQALRDLHEVRAERLVSKTRWRVVIRMARVLRRILADAPPKAASLRLEASSALTDANTALAYAPQDLLSAEAGV